MKKLLCVLLVIPLVAVADRDSAPEPQAGLYRVTAGFSGEGLPAEGVNTSVEQCVTEEELAADPGNILGENAAMEGCTITSYEWGGGKISMQMECAIEGALATAESRGTYNATGYELITTMRMDLGGTIVDMETFVRGERIGDC